MLVRKRKPKEDLIEGWKSIFDKRIIYIFITYVFPAFAITCYGLLIWLFLSFLEKELLIIYSYLMIGMLSVTIILLLLNFTIHFLNDLSKGRAFGSFGLILAFLGVLVRFINSLPC